MKTRVIAMLATSFFTFACTVDETGRGADPAAARDVIEAERGPATNLPDSAQGSTVRLLSDPIIREDALLPERHSAFESVEVSPNSLTYRFNGANPLRAGMAVGGGHGGGYIRRISRIETLADGRVRCETEEAAIEAIFERLDLEAEYRPVEERTVLEGGATDCHDVTPCHPLGSVGAERLRDSTAGEISLRSDVGNCEFGADGDIDFEADLDFDFDADFNVRVRRNFDFYVETRGEASAFVNVSGEGEVNGSCEADFAEAIFPRAPWTLLRFSVLGIPARIYAFPVLDGEITATAEGDFEAEVRLNATDSRTIGWRSRRWTNERETVVDFNRTLTADAEVDVEAELRVGIGLGIEFGADLVLIRAKGGLEASVYGAIRPHFHAEVHGDAVAGTLECPWSFEMPVSVEVEARAYAELGLLWWSFAPEETFGPWTLWERDLLSAEGDFCDPAQCTPQTCEALGCGDHANDGCGNAISCESCYECRPYVCQPGQCGTYQNECGESFYCDDCSQRVDCLSRGGGWCDSSDLCLEPPRDSRTCPTGEEPIWG